MAGKKPMKLILQVLENDGTEMLNLTLNVKNAKEGIEALESMVSSMKSANKMMKAKDIAKLLSEKN